jgi:hypothetical protein
MSALERTLSGVMGVPAVVVIFLTWIFPALLGWSLATIGQIVAGAIKARYTAVAVGTRSATSLS